MQVPREHEVMNKCHAESNEGGPKSERQQAAISMAELLFQSKSQGRGLTEQQEREKDDSTKAQLKTGGLKADCFIGTLFGPRVCL